LSRLLASFCIVLSVALSAGVAAPAHAAMDLAAAQKFILDGVSRANAIIHAHNEPRDVISAKLRVEFRRGFDIPTIANFALGRARGKLTPEQQKQYEHEFEELVVQTYTSRIIHYGPRVKTDISDIIRFTGAEMLSDTQVMLHSEVNRQGANWVKINWRVRRKGNSFAIIDISIFGISQAVLYRSEIESVVDRNGRGIDGLVDAMRKKNAAIERAPVGGQG
jgi:phospholipid transport system substrate-binding protein